MCNLKLAFAALSLIVLSSCQSRPTYDYWIQHPGALQDRYAQCQTDRSVSCETVRRAMRDYTVLTNEQSQGPIAFGMKILKAQQQWVGLKKAYEQAKKENDQNKLKLSQEAFQDQEELLHSYYAAVSRTVLE